MNPRTAMCRRTSRVGTEQGFTLVEVLICVVLLSLIMGALTAELISSLGQSKSTNQVVHESNDAQIIAGYLVRDAQAAGGTNPATGLADSTLGVSLSPVAGCNAPGTFVVGFTWNDFSPTVTTRHVAVYTYFATAGSGFSAQQLVRTTCVGAAAPVSFSLGNEILSAPVVTCLVGGSPASCGPTLPDQIKMQVTENNAPASATIPYSFTLTASVRTQSGSKPDSASPAPLVLLGRSGCGGSENTTGLSVESGPSFVGTVNVHVYGQTFVNTVNGSGCPAINLSGGATYQADSTTSILQGGTCSASGNGSTCPTGSAVASYAPALADPYAALVPPVGGANRSGCSGPGTYMTTLTVSSNCTLSSGTYVFDNGIKISGGASLTSSGPVLLYVKGGSFDASGAGPITVTGMSSGPYEGLVLWQDKSDSNPISLGGSNGGTSSFGGAIYAPAAEVSALVSTFFSANTVNALGIVAQALSVDATFSFFGQGGMNIGTKPPTVTSTTPSSRDAGAVNQDITITGNTFEANATVLFSNPGITVNSTTFVNATTLTANISISPTATLGAVDVTVVNPDGGFGTGTGVFTVNAAPTLVSITPSSRDREHRTRRSRSTAQAS